MTDVVAYVPDLLDRSKVAAAGARAQAAGGEPAEVRFVPRPEQLPGLAASARLVVVDLTRDGVLEAVAELAGPGGPRVIGFANHTRRELMDAALAAGCEVVMARSAFFSRLDEVLST